MILRAIAIDDEAPALAVIAAHLRKTPFIDLQGTFTSATEGLAWLQQHPVELVFLDIQMPDLLGTELIRLANMPHTLFVFITAYSEYAVEGFALRAFDYLLKPVVLSRFMETCLRAQQHFQSQLTSQHGLFVKDGHDWVRVNIADISYVRSDTNLLFIHHAGGVTVTRMTITALLEVLPATAFVRTHKSYIVALQAVRKLEKHQLTVGDTAIPLARSYRSQVARLLLGGKEEGSFG